MLFRRPALRGPSRLPGCHRNEGPIITESHNRLQKGPLEVDIARQIGGTVGLVPTWSLVRLLEQMDLDGLGPTLS
jgi:hypothetical protein